MVKIEIRHRVNPYTCMVSGIDDQYEWKTKTRLPERYLFWASGMCGFAYIKQRKADPPRMIFFGTNTKNQYDNLCRILNCRYTKFERLTSVSVIAKLSDFIKAGLPVIAGPLDMFHLPYSRFFHNTHIPIHYVMVVGIDDRNRLIVYDCDREAEQYVDPDSFRQALDVSVPGIGRKNTLHVFHWPPVPPTPKEIALSSLKLKIEYMLHPPIRNFGIPGMRKFAREVSGWRRELQHSEIEHSLRRMAAFMDDRFQGKLFDGGRTGFVKEYLAPTSDILGLPGLTRPAKNLLDSGNLLDALAKKIRQEDAAPEEISSAMEKIAAIEETAYQKMKECVVL